MLSLKKIKWFNHKDLFPLLLLFLIGFFLRSFRLNELLLFAYDQGSDAVILMDMIRTGNLIRLIGPESGLGGFFLGPFYYYLILPFYWLGKGNPVWAAVFLSFVGALAIPAIYFLAQFLFNKKSGLWAAVLLTFSFGAVEYSRWLCNPPPMIFFSILFFLFLIKSLQGKNFWAFWAGIFLGICLQLEFANAVFYLPLIPLYIFFVKKDRRAVIKFILLILGLGLTLIPLIVFDFRHKHLISQALLNPLQDKTTHTSLEAVFKNRPQFYSQFFKSKLIPQTFLLDKLLILIIGWSIIKILFRGLVKKAESKALFLLVLWFLLPLLGLLFYTGNYGQAWDYYLIGQIAPAGLLIVHFLKDLKGGRILNIRVEKEKVLLAFFAVYSALNYQQWTHLINPKNYNYSISHQLRAINYTFQQAKDKEFSVFIFVPNGRTESYDYLYAWESKKRKIEPPSTTALDNELIFLIYEPDPFLDEERFYEWYKTYEEAGKIKEKVEFGIITVEKRINEQD